MGEEGDGEEGEREEEEEEEEGTLELFPLNKSATPTCALAMTNPTVSIASISFQAGLQQM